MMVQSGWDLGLLVYCSRSYRLERKLSDLEIQDLRIILSRISLGFNAPSNHIII